MNNKYFGIIYLSYKELKLKIFDLKKLTTITTVAADINTVNQKENIYRDEFSDIIQNLKGFIRILKENGVDSYKMWGNRQLINDSDMRYLGEQIRVRTGLTVNWITENQLIYLKSISALEHLSKSLINEPSFLLLSYGSSSIALAKFTEGEFVANWQFDPDEQLNEEVVSSSTTTTTNPTEILDDIIGSALTNVESRIPLSKESQTLVIQDAEFLNQVFLKDGARVCQLSPKKFKKIYDEGLTSPNQYLEEKYNSPNLNQTQLIADFILLWRIVKLTNVKKLMLTSISAMNGLAVQESMNQNKIKRKYENMILSAAEHMADRYEVDTKHNQNVIQTAMHIFDQMKKVHFLNNRDRLLLQLAGHLDDIGNFVNHANHFNNSAYIIKANKIIGLSNRENEILAEITRYHSVASSSNRWGTEEHFKHLDPNIQLVVAKLAAILRLADSLDKSREQKVKKINVSLKNDVMVIKAHTTEDLTLERWMFNRSAKLFEKVYGIRPVLKQRMINK